MTNNINLIKTNSPLGDSSNSNLNKNWIEWFIGFCDADGNFQTFPKHRKYLKKDGSLSEYYNIGYGIHISLSIKDLGLIQEIQNTLNGVGHIYTYPDREEARLSITKTKELVWMIENIFDLSSLVSLRQRDRYLRFRHGVLNKFNRVESLEEYNNFLNTSYSKELEDSYFKSVAFDNWIVGFVNGEGCFHVHNRGHLIFYIEHTDLDSLIYIKKRFDLGPAVNYREARSDKRQPTYVLSISSKKDIETIKTFFNNPELSKLAGLKSQQFSVWLKETKK